MRATRMPEPVLREVRRLVAALLILCLAPIASAHAQAANVAVAKDFVSSLSRQGIAILADKSLPRDQQIAKFREMLKADVDLPRLARFTLGQYWRVATPAQKQEFQNLFQEYILSTYVYQLGDYSGQTIDVGTARPESESLILVQSMVNQPGGAPPVQVNWRIWVANGQAKLVDVVVEGVSMAVTLRSQFASIIQNGGGNVEALLTRMRAIVRPGSGATGSAYNARDARS